jgi:hypothetical protein
MEKIGIAADKMNILKACLRGIKKMRNFKIRVMAVIILLIFLIPISPKADEENFYTREDVFSLLHSAFLAQLSLNEKERTMEEIKLILDPYFSEDYQQLFLEANLYEENEKYVTYGTDFGEYFIPFFKFSESTKVVVEDDVIYVFEYFPKNTYGPVGYDSHYEGLSLIKSNGQWKISNYLYDDIPEKIIKKALDIE